VISCLNGVCRYAAIIAVVLILGHVPCRSAANASLEFCDIDNIHVMRDCLKRLATAIRDEHDDGWLAAVDSSKWLQV